MKSTIILSAILSLFRFGDHVLFSLRNRRLEVVGASFVTKKPKKKRIFSDSVKVARCDFRFCSMIWAVFEEERVCLVWRRWRKSLWVLLILFS